MQATTTVTTIKIQFLLYWLAFHIDVVSHGIPAHASICVCFFFFSFEASEMMRFKNSISANIREFYINYSKANCRFLGMTATLLFQSADCLCMLNDYAVCRMYRLEFYICQRSKDILHLSVVAFHLMEKKKKKRRNNECNWRCVCVRVWCMRICKRICHSIQIYAVMHHISSQGMWKIP